jgi:hypothetical protein
MPAELVPRIKRMVAAAFARTSDAEALERSLSSTSDSAYLLKLLAFEILLKALVRINGGAPQKTHSYLELFHLLPKPVRDRMLARAATRMADSADFSNAPETLRNSWRRSPTTSSLFDIPMRRTSSCLRRLLREPGAAGLLKAHQTRKQRSFIIRKNSLD